MRGGWIGPVFGLLDLAVWNRWHPAYTPFLVAEFVIGIGLVVAAITVGVREQGRDRPHTRTARLLGAVFLVDTCVYFGPLAAMIPRLSGLGTFGWLWVGLFVLVNLLLAGMSAAILVRCRRRTRQAMDLETGPLEARATPLPRPGA